MPNTDLLRADDSVLLIVDMQSRLTAALPAGDRERALGACSLLARAAGELQLPIIATRQYPIGLGPLEPDLEALLPPSTDTIDKTTFSAAAVDAVGEALRMTGRQQVVVCGVEAHVCVWQTAAGLADAGYTPVVCEDAVASRHAQHAGNALARMRSAGITIACAEAALFEWLRDARHPAFKSLSKLLR